MTTWVQLGSSPRSGGRPRIPVRPTAIGGIGPDPVTGRPAAPRRWASSARPARPARAGDAPSSSTTAGAGFGQHAVGGSHHAGALWPRRWRRTSSTPSTSRARSRADHVDDGVVAPDLVEVDLSAGRRCRRPSTSASAAKVASARAGHPIGQARLGDQADDVGVGTHHDWSCTRDDRPGGGDAAPQHGLDLQRPAADGQPLEQRRTSSSRRRRRPGCRGPCPRRCPAKQWNQATVARPRPGQPGGRGPVRARSTAGRGHGSIRATAQAAPKPLSIPTTVIPAAHEACMASRAVTPSRPRRSRCWWARRPPAPGDPADQARQRPFHAGHHDDGVGLRQLVGGGQQPVHPGHPAVGQQGGSQPQGDQGGRALAATGRSEVPAVMTRVRAIRVAGRHTTVDRSPRTWSAPVAVR